MDNISVANYFHQLAPLWGMSPIQSVPFDQPEVALQQVLAALGRKPDVVLAVDDSGLELAALLRERLHLPGSRRHACRKQGRTRSRKQRTAPVNWQGSPAARCMPDIPVNQAKSPT